MESLKQNEIIKIFSMFKTTLDISSTQSPEGHVCSFSLVFSEGHHLFFSMHINHMTTLYSLCNVFSLILSVYHIYP